MITCDYTDNTECRFGGFLESSHVEAFKRIFVFIRLFCTPSNTQNIVLHLVTNVEKVYLHTMMLNLNYLLELFRIEQSRLPLILAK